MESVEKSDMCVLAFCLSRWEMKDVKIEWEKHADMDGGLESIANAQRHIFQGRTQTSMCNNAVIPIKMWECCIA